MVDYEGPWSATALAEAGANSDFGRSFRRRRASPLYIYIYIYIYTYIYMFRAGGASRRFERHWRTRRAGRPGSLRALLLI